jgi:hypothetical protein
MAVGAMLAGTLLLPVLGISQLAVASEPTTNATSTTQYVAVAFDKYQNYQYTNRKTAVKFTDGTNTYIYNKVKVGDKIYLVREGYSITVDENAGKYTPLSTTGTRVDVSYTGSEDEKPTNILETMQSTVSSTGTNTNLGETLNKVEAGSYSGVSNSAETEVPGGWDYIIADSSWEGHVDSINYKNGYVDLTTGGDSPLGFITAGDKLKWSDALQSYTYNGKVVDYSNLYVIGNKIGVFTNYDGSKVYTGNVYGSHNEVLMTAKKDGEFYSYWAAKVTDPGATMSTYRVTDYQNDLQVLSDNDQKLYRNDIKEVQMKKEDNTATIQLMRNGDDKNNVPVDGAIKIASGGGIGGSGVEHDTYVSLTSGDTTVSLPTGTKVEAIGDKNNTTGIKINGEEYTISAGVTNGYLKFAANSGDTVTNKLGSTVKVEGTGTKADSEYSGKNVKTKVSYDADGYTTIDVMLDNNIDTNSVKVGKDGADGTPGKDGVSITGPGGVDGTNGLDGKVGISGKDGKDAVSISGKDGVGYIGLTGPAGKDGVSPTADISVKDGDPGVNGADGTTMTRVVYTDKDGKEHQVSTLDDGMKYMGDSGTTAKVQLNKTVNIVGGVTDSTKLSDNNIGVVSSQDGDNGKLKIKLAKDITGLDSISADTVKAGDTVTISKDGIDNGGQKITNVAAGTDLTDAVNYSQLTTSSAAATTEVKAGDNVSSVAKTTDATDGHAIYTVNVNDMTAKSGTVTYGTDGTGTGTLTNGDGSTTTISGLKNTYTTTSTLNGTKATFTRNDGETYDLDLSNLKTALGTADYRLVGSGTDQKGAYTVDSNNKVKLNVYDPSSSTTNTVEIDGVASTDDITNVNNTINNLKTDGIKVAGDTGSSTTQLGKKVSIVGDGKNITTVDAADSDNGSTVTVSMSDTPTFTSATIGGVDIASGKISNLTAGTADTDAVNVSQLTKAKDDVTASDLHVKKGSYAVTSNSITMPIVKGTADTATADNVILTGVASTDDITNVNNTINNLKTDGIKVAGDTGSSTTQLGKKVSIVGDGKNITTVDAADSDNGSTVTVSMSDTPTFTSATIGGVSVAGGKISNLTAGTADTDAVNVSQLNSKTAAATTEVKAGDNVSSVAKTTDATDGHAIYTVNVNDMTAKSGTVTYGTDGTGTGTLTNGDGSTTTISGLKNTYTTTSTLNGTKATFTRNDGETYDLDLSNLKTALGTADYRLVGSGTDQKGAYTVDSNNKVKLNVYDPSSSTTNTVEIDGVASTDDITNVNNTINNLKTDGIKVAGDTGSSTTQLGKKVSIIGDGKNITTVDAADSDNGSTVTVSMSDTPTFTSATIGGVSVAGGKISNLTAGTADTDAVNVSQLTKAKDDVTASDLHVKKGSYAVTSNSVTMPIVKGTADTATADNVVLTGVASTDDITNVNNTINNLKTDGIKVAGDTGSSTTQLGKKVSIVGDGKNITTVDAADSDNGSTVTVSMSDTPTFTSATIGGVSVAGGKISNLTAGTADTDAVNVSQLTKAKDDVTASDLHVKKGSYAVTSNSVTMPIVKGTADTATADNVVLTGVASTDDITNVNNTINNLKTDGIKVAGDTGSSTTQLGKKVSIVGDGKNITTVDAADSDNGSTVTVSMSDTPTFTSATIGGVDIASGKISNLTAGTADTDAVNVSQLNSKTAAATTEVKAGDNVSSVAKTTDATDGHAIYTVNVNDMTAKSGTVTYGTDGAGTGTLTNGDGSTTTITGLKDTYTKSGALNGTTETFTRNDGSTYDVDLSGLSTGLTNSGLKFAANSGDTVTNKLGSTVTVAGAGTKDDSSYSGDNIKTKVSQDADGNTTIDVMLDNNLSIGGKDGKDGSIGINGADGVSGVGIDGKDGISIKGADGKNGVTIKGVDGTDGTEGHIGLTGPKGTDGTNATADIHVKPGDPGVNGADGTTMTRVVYEDQDGIPHQVATLDDGMKYMGDSGDTAKVKLNKTVNVVGGVTDTSSAYV